MPRIMSLFDAMNELQAVHTRDDGEGFHIVAGATPQGDTSRYVEAWRIVRKEVQRISALKRRDADRRSKSARILQENRGTIVSMIEAGATWSAIGSRFGMGPTVAKLWADSLGLKKRPSRNGAEQFEAQRPEIERLSAKGMTGKEIAAAVGMSPSRLSYLMKQYGMKPNARPSRYVDPKHASTHPTATRNRFRPS